MSINVKQCPLCGQTRFNELYRHVTAFDPSYSHFGVAQDNCLLRDVFLVDRIERTLMWCRNCGMCFISPTFTGPELERLYKTARMRDHYALVKTTKPSPAASINHPESIWSAEEKHSQFIFDRVRDVANVECLKDMTVVDVGGQYGYHLRHFLAAGARGVLQDVVRQQTIFPGVEYSATLAQIRHADIAICTHVFEHVVNLREFVEQIAAIQPIGAVCYVEVPYELDSRLRNHDFGVPFHVNYFSIESLVNVMRMAGYRNAHCSVSKLTYGGQPILAVYGIFVREQKQAGNIAFIQWSRWREILRGGIWRTAYRWLPGLIQW